MDSFEVVYDEGKGKFSIFVNGIMRLIRFYNRLKNQYKIHRRWATLWTIAKIAWVQSKNKKIEMVGIVEDRSVIPMIGIDIDEKFDNTINDA